LLREPLQDYFSCLCKCLASVENAQGQTMCKPWPSVNALLSIALAPAAAWPESEPELRGNPDKARQVRCPAAHLPKEIAPMSKRDLVGKWQFLIGLAAQQDPDHFGSLLGEE
jgi:hypothetical protein